MSKYFSLPVDNASVDSESIQFFDALSESTQNVKTLDLHNTPSKISTKVGIDVSTSKKDCQKISNEGLISSASDGNFIAIIFKCIYFK